MGAGVGAVGLLLPPQAAARANASATAARGTRIPCHLDKMLHGDIHGFAG